MSINPKILNELDAQLNGKNNIKKFIMELLTMENRGLAQYKNVIKIKIDQYFEGDDDEN